MICKETFGSGKSRSHGKVSGGLAPKLKHETL